MIEYVALVDKGLIHATCDDSILIGHNIISNGKFIGHQRIKLLLMGLKIHFITNIICLLLMKLIIIFLKVRQLL